MKIVYYSPHPNLSVHSPAGYGTHMREMIAAFKKAGNEVVPVIMGDKIEVTQEKKISHQAKHQVVKRAIPAVVWESMKDYALLRKDRSFEKILMEIVLKEQPDLIYERANYMQLSGVQVAQKLRIPHILEVNAPYVEEHETFARASSIYEAQAVSIEKKQLQMTGQVVVVSQALRDYFVEKHRLSSRIFTIVPNAVDPEKIRSSERCVAKIRDAYALNDKYVLGFVGSLFKWHGVDRLIRACHVLQKRKANLVAFIVGGGEILPELRELSRSLGVEDKIIFTDNVPHEDVFDYIETMDIAVLPNSHWYGSPVKIFEYGAMGKPIVAPKNWPVREVMTPGQDGILVKDERDLIDKLSMLMENPVQCKRMGKTFQQKVLREHTWARNAERVLQTVEAVLA